VDELLRRAAQSLVDESSVSMVSPSGQQVEVWTISCRGELVAASAPRLLVATEMELACRLLLDQIPHRIVSVVDRATVKSAARASLVLRVVEATPDGVRRRSARLPLSTAASLRSLVCDRIVPGETLRGTIADISVGGVGVRLADSRPRPGDRMELSARFFEGALEGEVRVRSVRPSEHNTVLVGCELLSPTAAQLALIDRVVERLLGER
jgi:hypothetical protein